MPAPTSPDEAARRYAAIAAHPSIAAAARALGMSANALRGWTDGAQRGGRDPALQAAMDAVGTGLVPGLVWAKTKSDEGTSFSVLLKPSQQTPEQLLDALRAGLEGLEPGRYQDIPTARPDPTGGLLVIDHADLHVGKLSVKTETGYEYNRGIAVARMLHGTKALLRKAAGHGVARVLMVLGNDILHIDTPKGKTTSGTEQDTDGSLHQMYADAQQAYVAAIEACAAEYPVDLIFCPSNHDWVMGWALANSIGVWFRNHPNVNATGYNLSPAHRKYYRYENNLIGLTHGDGAKEADLYPLMMTEARSHVSGCSHRYWYLHHLHHKIRKAQGVRPHDREKDHIGLTMIKSGMGAQEGDNVQIEYVRSASPPDGWHDRNGYVNRQAVECFIHDPRDGQNARFTEWF